jgi:hypothetical protein
VAKTFAVGQVIDNLLHLYILNNPAQSNAFYVVERDHHFQAAGLDAQEVKAFDRGSHGAAADLLDNADTMIGVNNLVTYFES